MFSWNSLKRSGRFSSIACKAVLLAAIAQLLPPSNAAATTCAVSGTITISGTSTGLNAANVAITDNANSANDTSAPTDVSGYFTASVDCTNGDSYTITPSSSGYQFSPVSASSSSLVTDWMQDFTATLNTYPVGGTVYYSTGTPTTTGWSGAQILISSAGWSATITASSTGYYEMDNLPYNGNFTLTPQATGYWFTPVSVSSSALTANWDQDFAATIDTFTLGGTVYYSTGTPSTAGWPGAQILISSAGWSATITASSTGYFEMDNVPYGSYTLVPQATGYWFTPVSVSSSALTATWAQNFEATLDTSTISGMVYYSTGTPATSGWSGAQILISSAGWSATITASSTGYYEMDNVPYGSFTLTPQATGYWFAPVTVSSTNLTANWINNFAAIIDTYTASGSVSYSTGTPMAGAQIIVSSTGWTSTITTNALGNFSVDLPYAGNFTMTPNAAGYWFTPVSVSSGNLFGAWSVTPFNATIDTYTLSGMVYYSTGTPSTAGWPGAQILISSADWSATITASSTGYYEMDSVPYGSYALAPQATGYWFTPVTASTSPLTASWTQNFAATIDTFTVSGVVYYSTGTPATSGVSGAQIVISSSGWSSTITASSTGYYEFDSASYGSYTLTPHATNYWLTPVTASSSSLTANWTQNFTETLDTFTVSGTISLSGSGFADAVVAVGGGATTSVSTLGDGTFSVDLPCCANYTITPSSAGYTFSPLALSTSPLTSAWSANNFTATALTDSPSLVYNSTGAATYAWYPSANVVVALSTNSFTDILSSGTITAGATSYASLSPDTTYYFEKKLSTQPDSDFLTISSATLAQQPYNLDFVYTSLTELGLNWDSANQDYTLYNVQFSSGAFLYSFSGDSTHSGAYEGGLVFGGFLPNTTYYARVQAVNSAGTASWFSDVSAASTLPNSLSPDSLSISSVSVTALFTPLPIDISSDSCEGYLLSVSTASDMSGTVYTSTVSNPSATALALSGLATNSTYYYTFGTLNWQSAANNTEPDSFVTLTSTPTAFTPIDSVYVSSAAFSWSAPLPPSVNDYVLYASSSAAGVTLSSETLTAPSAADPLYVTGLLPNTTYTFAVSARNILDVDNYSPVTYNATTLSLPVDINSITTTVSAFSITTSWKPLQPAPDYNSCNGYELYVYADAAFTALVSTATSMSYATSSAQIIGLKPNTPYYLRLSTFNRNNMQNYVNIGLVRTAQGAALSGLAIPAISTGSMTVVWNPYACEGYEVDIATSSDFSGTLYSSSSLSTYLSGLTVSSLTPNTSYYIHAGDVFSGATNYTLINSMPLSTLTYVIPTATPPSVTAAYYSSATVTWTTLPFSPNSATSEGYLVQASSTAFNFGGTIVSTATPNSQNGTLTAYQDSNGNGMLPNTSYYMEIGSLNWNGTANFSTVISTSVTLANLPIVSSSPTVTATTLLASWSANSNPSDTWYKVQLYSDPAYLSQVQSSTTLNTWATFSGLTPDTTYYSRMYSLSRTGTATGPVYLAPSLLTASPPASASFSAVGVNVATATWSSSNPSGTVYAVQLSTSSGFSTVYSSSAGVSGSAYEFSGLSGNTTYYGRVAAINSAGIYSNWTGAGGMLTSPAVPTDAYSDYSDVRVDQFQVNWSSNTNSTGTQYTVEISTNSNFAAIYSLTATTSTYAVFGDTVPALPQGTTFYSQVMATGYGGAASSWYTLGSTVTVSTMTRLVPFNTAVSIVLPTSYGDISLYIDSGSFQQVGQISMTPSASFPTAACPTMTLKPVGIGVTITISPAMQPLVPLSLTLPYRDSDITGHNAANLLLAYYDTTNKIWVPSSSMPNPSGKYVTAQLTHLSQYQLMEAVSASTISNVKIFPNPFSPPKGHHYMQFTNLPGNTQIRIFTILGELVRELDASSSGTAVWDGTNRFGNNAASGVYIVLIQGPGGKKEVKIAVER